MDALRKEPPLSAEPNQQCSEFPTHLPRRVSAQFGAQQVSSAEGLPPLQKVDWRIDLIEWAAESCRDDRNSERTEHRVAGTLSQAIYGSAMGYEDLTDNEQLRSEPLLVALAGRRVRNPESVSHLSCSEGTSSTPGPFRLSDY